MLRNVWKMLVFYQSKNMHCHYPFVSVGVYTFTQVFKGDSHEIQYMYMDLSEIQTPEPKFLNFEGAQESIPRNLFRKHM